MSTIINTHIIQSVPASLLNRDDNGTAKSITYGNVRRDRISSQSWKRAVRESMRTEHIDGGVWGNRTNKLPRMIADQLATTHGYDKDTTTTLVDTLFAALGMKRKDNGDTSASIFANPTAATDLAHVANTYKEQLTAGETTDKEMVTAAINALDATTAIDIALFGRMLAEIPTEHVDGAAGYSHPFGITPSTVEPDFFTAVDDCADPALGDATSGNLGTTDLTSPILYRHAYLDTVQLAHNLAGNADLVDSATELFIRHTTTATPSAKQRNTAAHTLPDILIVTVSDHNTSAANAYANPITGADAATEGITRLIDQIEYISRVITQKTIALPLTPQAKNLLDTTEHTMATVATIDELFTEIRKA